MTGRFNPAFVMPSDSSFTPSFISLYSQLNGSNIIIFVLYTPDLSFCAASNLLSGENFTIFPSYPAGVSAKPKNPKDFSCSCANRLSIDLK